MSWERKSEVDTAYETLCCLPVKKKFHVREWNESLYFSIAKKKALCLNIW